MKKQLTGFAWIFFGLLLYAVLRDVWTPVVGDYIWIASLLCGLIGLAVVIRHSGPDA